MTIKAHIKDKSHAAHARVDLPMAALFLLILLYVVVQYFEERRAKVQEASNIASVAAAGYSWSDIEWLSGSPADFSSPNYLKLKAKLAKTKAAFKDLHFAYTLGIREAGVFFYADSEPPEKDLEDPEMNYPDAPADMVSALEHGRFGVIGPYTDSYGTWVSAYVPLLDPEGNHGSALFVVDIDAADWHFALLKKMALPLVFALFCIGFLLAIRQTQKNLEISQHSVKQGRDEFLSLFQRLRAFMDNIPLAAWMLDTEGRYALVNQEYEKLTGKSAGELFGKLHSDLWDAETAAFLADISCNPSAGTTRKPLEKTLTINGQPRDFTILTTPIPDGKRGSDGTVGALVDITERNKLNEEVSHNALLLNTLLDSIPDIVFFKNKEGIYLGCNSALTRLLGIPSENIIGKTDRDFMPEAAWDHCFIGDQKVLRTAEIVSNEEVVSDPEGKQIVLLMIKAPMHNAQGKIFGVVGVGRDISERKQKEQELLQAQKATEAAQGAKNRFLSMVSHEMRTPLTSIMGFSEILASGELSEEDKDFAQTIHKSARSLLELVDKIMAFSEEDEGRQILHTEKVDLLDTAESMAQPFRALADNKGIVLQVDLAADAPSCTRTDPALLRRVINHLLDNAVKFTESGSIALTVHRAKNLGDPSQGEQIEFRVSDTGIGMSPEELAHIFTPLTQADNSERRRYAGIGMGLAAASKMATLLRGSIRAESRKGVGSTFIVTIPHAPA